MTRKTNTTIILFTAFFCILSSCFRNSNIKKLKQPEFIQSYPCKGTVHFDKSGNLTLFTLSQDHEVRGVEIPNNSIIEIQGNEMLIYLSQPTTIQGKLVRERKHTNDHCTLDKAGNLIFFVPENDIVIDSVFCKRQKDVWLYPSGRLFMCHLAGDLQHSGTNFLKDDFVLINEKGIMQEHSWKKFNEIRSKGLYPENH